VHESDGQNGVNPKSRGSAADLLIGRSLTPGAPERALTRLLIFLRASEAHHGADQRGMVWEPVRDLIIAPTVGLGPLP